MAAFSAYIFDFDGTLFDTRAGVGLCYERAFRELGGEYDPSMLETYMKEPLDRTFARFWEDPCRYREFVACFLAESEASMCATTAIFPDTAEALARVQGSGAAMGIVSGKTEVRIREILGRFGLGGMFRSIVGFERTKASKPDPSSLEMCLGELGEPPCGAVYVGDSPLDVAAAEAAGATGILIDRGGGTPGALTDLRMLP
jgi:phosphoglycolate phosphatase-like HAD superfamily hydrolase